jgi:hypothetical protein
MRRIALLLTAAIGTAALLAIFYPSMMINAADVAPRVEGENFATRPAGTTVVTNTTLYSNNQALKFTQPVTASHTLNCSAVCDVQLMARGGQSGGSPTLKVNGAPAQAITNSASVQPYIFDVNLPAGQNQISVTAANTGTGRNPFLDFASFPASGSTPTDTDSDGVPDSTDQCDTQPGPAPSGCPLATSSAILVGAGDISSGGSRDQETGDLVRAELSRGAWGVFTTGDNAYPDGTYQNYLVYDAAWGSFRNKTRPTYGNHDYYGSSTAVGSQQYWNEGPDPTPVQVSNAASFYTYEVANSNWRAIVLNSADTEGPTSNQAPSCAAGSPQMNFLNNQLNTTKNTVLFWHHARFSASTDHPTSEGATGCSKTFFDVAYDKRADLVLQGHSHLYERYETRDKSGTKVSGGLTSVVCGLGGNSFDGLQGSPSPAYDRAFTNAWGVCKLTLNANNAQVNFLPAPGSPGTDSATVAVRP